MVRMDFFFIDLCKERPMRICSHAVAKILILPVHSDQKKASSIKRRCVQYVLRVVRNI